MKKVMSFLLIFIMLFSFLNISYGYSGNEGTSVNNNSIIPIENYNEFKVDMEAIDFSNQIQTFTIIERNNIKKQV